MKNLLKDFPLVVHAYVDCVFHLNIQNNAVGRMFYDYYTYV
jgi:hypothetical protein